MQALPTHPDRTCPEGTHPFSGLVLQQKMRRNAIMEQQPTPTPEPQKQARWRPITMMAAAVGLGGALLAFHEQQPSHRESPQPQPQVQPSRQAIPMLEGAFPLSMLPPDEAVRAVARSSFSNQQKPALLAALKENRVRLAAMPLADAAGHTGQLLTVSGGGFTQQVVLGPKAKAVLLPIAQEGIVTLTRVSPAKLGPVSVATLDMFHNVVVLPPLTQASPSFAIPVIVQ